MNDLIEARRSVFDELNEVGQKFRLGIRVVPVGIVIMSPPLEWSFRPRRITRVFRFLSVNAIDKD